MDLTDMIYRCVLPKDFSGIHDFSVIQCAESGRIHFGGRQLIFEVWRTPGEWARCLMAMAEKIETLSNKEES